MTNWCDKLAANWLTWRTNLQLQAYCKKEICLEYSFASEAPGSAGLWQKRALLVNHPSPKILFDDLLVSGLDRTYYKLWQHNWDWRLLDSDCFCFLCEARSTHRGVDWTTKHVVEVPPVSVYTGGFECQDSCLQKLVRVRQSRWAYRVLVVSVSVSASAYLVTCDCNCELWVRSEGHAAWRQSSDQDLSCLNTMRKSLDLNLTKELES